MLTRTIALIFLTIPLAAGDLTSRIVTVTETKALDAAPSGTLHLENSRGEVTIEGWDQPRVQITVVKSTTGLFRATDPAERDAAAHLLDHAQVKSERSGDEILISTQVPRSDRGRLIIDYHINAPRASKIVIGAASGGVYITGMAGDIQASLKQGELTLVLPGTAGYGIHARAKFGEVYSALDGGSGGNDQRHHLLGHSLETGEGVSTAPNPTAGAPAPAHKLHLRVGFGDIAITKAFAAPAS